MISIKIKGSNEAAFSMTISPTALVSELKAKILEEQKDSSATASSLRLIFAGRVLKDEETLDKYKVLDGNTIHLVKSAAPKPQAATEETPRATPSQAAPAAAPGPAPANPMASGMEGMGANPMLAALLGGQAGGAQAGNPFAGLGGNAGAAGGMPGLPPMDPSMLQNLLSNPQMMSTMTAMMSNPGFLDMVLASNPQLSGAMGPQQREMMRGMMSNPQLMQSLLPMMAAMNGIPTGQTPGQGQQQQQGTTDSTPSGMPPLPMPFLNNPALMGLMNQQGLGGSGGAPGASQVPPEERFQVQLSQLQDMGFFDPTENIRALTLTNGNVEAAVEWLFSHPPGSM